MASIGSKQWNNVMSLRKRRRSVSHRCQTFLNIKLRFFLSIASCCFAIIVVFRSVLGVSVGSGGHLVGVEDLSPTTRNKRSESSLGAIVLLAPQRNEGSIWEISRFCMLLRAVRSIDHHLNRQFGPYPIFILVAKDYKLDPKGKDAVYTPRDRALLQNWAPNSTIHFQEVNLYSEDALEPNVTAEEISQWRAGKNGGIAGRDIGYQSMCRLWSGRLQSMSFLDGFTYYLRMDDDSLFTKDFAFDPFQRMKEENLEYVYRRKAKDKWGIRELWKVSKPYVDLNRQGTIPFLYGYGVNRRYGGSQPYNNFHISTVSFWRSKKWSLLWEDMNRNHLFFKYRVGDANVHAIALMLMKNGSYAMWPEVPYVHNSNDYSSWGKKAWKEECDLAMSNG
eukprot:scaffold2214_cov139-Cylindrotheca_fusiformis.AAC.15